MKILIVENEFITQMHLENIVKEMGFQVVGCASSYNLAVQLVNENKPDLVFLDIGLEGDKNGIDVAEYISKKKLSKIIFITGNFDRYTMDKAREIESLGFIEKPFNNYDFKERFFELTMDKKAPFNE